MDYNLSKVQIADGVDACIVDAKGFKTACVSFTFAVNLSEANGVNSLVAKLLLRSSADYDDFTLISRRLAELYGAELYSSVIKLGEQQIIKITATFIGDRFALFGESIAENCSDLLLDLIFKPNIKNGAFKSDEVESEKRLLTEHIDGEINDKGVYAKNKLEQLMFPDELYSLNRFGQKEKIKELSAEDAAKAYYEFLKSAVIRVNLVGDISFDGILDKLRQRFAGIERKPVTLSTLFRQSADTVRYESETDDINQGKLVMGFRAGMENSDDHYYATRVMVDLFGGGTYSKLFKVVREKMSLCYYCSARLVSQKGIMLVQSGIETENEEKTKEAVLAQLEEMKNGNFTDEELKASIDSLTDRFGNLSDTPDRLDDWYSQLIVSPELKKPAVYAENIAKVTREDVISAARLVTLDTIFMLRSSEKEEKTDA